MDSLKWIEIDMSAIRSNLQWICDHLSEKTKLMAVVKADAYGHGAEKIGRLALQNGASTLGVLTLAEAQELRRAGIRSPVVLLSPPLATQARAAAQGRFEPTVDSEALLKALNQAARAKLSVHVDVDLGLKRWGVTPGRLFWLIEHLRKYRRLRLAGLSAHLDYVPGKNAVEAETKLRNFHRLAAQVKRAHPDTVCHAANSSIFLDFSHWQMDMVRIGNLMYGINTTSGSAPLKNPWKFYARIISLAKIAKGTAIGYASEFVAPKSMTVATLPAGYSDGLTMEPAERLIGFGRGFQYWGWLKGYQTPFVGRCGIAHVLVDVSRVPNPKIGEPVLLPIRRTAANPRIPRIYR